jgi:hypothetical protein
VKRSANHYRQAPTATASRPRLAVSFGSTQSANLYRLAPTDTAKARTSEEMSTLDRSGMVGAKTRTLCSNNRDDAICSRSDILQSTSDIPRRNLPLMQTEIATPSNPIRSGNDRPSIIPLNPA